MCKTKVANETIATSATSKSILKDLLVTSRD